MPQDHSRRIAQLEERLGDFDADVRRGALRELKRLADSGAVAVKEVTAAVNLHSHTFFSFNANGYSPSGFAWEAYKRGLEMAGIVDFDVLDGVQEILEAGEILGLKTEAGIETRVFIPEFADREINSPNEPGVYYLMGVGFWRSPEPGTRAARVLGDMGRRARARNIEMMNKINDYLGKVRIDYEKDVLVLTPSGNATERHMLVAYDRKAREVFADRARLLKFWAKALQESVEDVASVIDDPAKFHGLVRKKLMKGGGVGYAKPQADTFPRMDEVNEMTIACGAIPTACWLDGTTEGEKNADRLLEFFVNRSIMALNIIPDRNWNYAEGTEKTLKTAKLKEIIEAARKMYLPLVVGTEMNKPGQPFVDDFEAPELADYVPDFLAGARFVYGHTILGRFADFGLLSDGAQSVFGADRQARLVFYTEAGSWGPATEEVREKLRRAAGSADPGKLLEIVSAGRSKLADKY